MANKSLLAQMLERLVNEDQAKAEELFHEYVVEASREIYESLIESEIQEESEEEEDDLEEASEEDEEEEDDLEESSEEDEEEDDLEENFEDVAVEAGEEGGDFGGDETGDLGHDMGMGDEEGEDLSGESEQELFQDLDAIVDELQARFDALGGEGGEEEMGDEEELGDGMDPQLATVREYVEKVPAGHGAEKKGGAEGQLSGTGSQSDKPSVNTKSTIDNMKNDMGGTTANILSSKEDAPVFAGAAGGKLKGTPLSDQSPKDMNTGNINVPGGNAGKTSFKKKEPGHGAEKKGGGEGVLSGTGNHSDKPSVNSQSLFRGRR